MDNKQHIETLQLMLDAYVRNNEMISLLGNMTDLRGQAIEEEKALRAAITALKNDWVSVVLKRIEEERQAAKEDKEAFERHGINIGLKIARSIVLEVIDMDRIPAPQETCLDEKGKEKTMNYPTIEFKPFDFPSWEEVKEERQDIYHHIYSEIAFNMFIYMPTYCALDKDIGKMDDTKYYIKISLYDKYRSDVPMLKHTYIYNEENYAQACQQLNDWKYELYCEAGNDS